jgi:HEAT repeat protein
VSRRLADARRSAAALLLSVAAIQASGARAQVAGGEDPPSTPPADTAPAVDAGALGAVARVLAPPADGPAPDAAAMAAAICELGSPAVPVLVGLLAGEVELAESVPGTADGAVHPAALEQRAAVLRAALECLPSGAVLAHLGSRLQHGPQAGTRLWIAGLLGGIDDPRACEQLLELIEGLDALALRPRHAQETLAGALAAHLVRQPEALDDVWPSGPGVPPERLVVFARALGAVRSTRGIDLLASWIGLQPEADGELLEQLGRVAGEGGLAVTPEALAAVRSRLGAGEPDVRRSAIVAAGRLRDEEAFEELAGMLADPSELVASNARWSLQEICGVDLGTEGQAWLDWRERERAWLAEQAPALLEDLSSDVPGVVLAAVAEALRHPFHRHALAEALGPLCIHPDPWVARGVCAAIPRLESARSVPWLLAALRQPDPELQGHAAKALQRLTGLELLPEHDVWAAALSGTGGGRVASESARQP